MRTMRSLRACHVQANAWLRDCWQKSGMIASATRMPAVCAPSSLEALDHADHRQHEPKTLHFLGFQLGMPKKDHASERLSRKAKRLDSREWRGTLVHALLKAFLHLSCF